MNDMNRERIDVAIREAIKEVNATLPTSMQLEETAASETFGRGGKLDRLGLVNLLLAVEEKLAALGVNVSLPDERARSQTRSPFRSVKALGSFIENVAGASRVHLTPYP